MFGSLFTTSLRTGFVAEGSEQLRRMREVPVLTMSH